ncbi:MAG: glycosyltransferase family 2 protein [Lachnospiraceae bacterium]|nr:glycosyltransferase family 2 protein [Lachnospiraceae bacterium]
MAKFLNDYEKGLLSVIVVTYNQKEFFYETLSSILNQDYRYIELIIADDGTLNFDEGNIKKFIDDKKNKNIIKYRILHNKENIGTVRNINNALKKSTGEFIKIIGGDDTYPNSSTFSSQIKVLLSNERLLATVGMAQQCDYNMNPIKDERVDKSNKYMPNILKMDYDKARKTIFKNDIFPIAIQAVCYRREFFVKNGLCDEDYVLIDDSPSA